MSETTMTVQVARTWPRAASDWPDESRPAAGDRPEGCWFLGLAGARVDLDRVVAPHGPRTVTDAADAEDMPALRRLLEIEGIDAVTATGTRLFLSSRSLAGDAWSPALEQARAIVGEELESQESELHQRVKRVLDEEVNPGVASHGGHITLLEVRGATAYIEMGGGCQGCGMASVTLKAGVESAIKGSVPEVTEILDTTDHASGTNPYYAPSAK